MIYPAPVAARTTKRCRFNLPGRHYNCRAIGKYVLDGKGYCAAHYDIAWKVANPVFGQQHQFKIRNGYSYPTCARCGAVRQHDGLPQEPCRGHFACITLRDR